MSSFVDVIKDSQVLSDEHTNELKSIVKAYPWFVTAKMMLMKVTEQGSEEWSALSESVDLRMNIYPAPKFLLVDINKNLFKKFDSFGIIDEFLSGGDFVIKAIQSNDNKVDMSLKSSVLKDDLMTETLAELMASQGNYNQAREIYTKLSLKYPEKSVTFARLIRELPR